MPLHVSCTVVLIIMRANCIMQHLVSSRSVGGRDGHLQSVYTDTIDTTFTRT